MGRLVSVMPVMIFLALFSFMALSINKESNGFKEPSAPEFKAYTSVVCENRDNLSYCKDELIINCNGKIYKSGEIEECNGIGIDGFKVSGFAVYGRDWKDPRI